MMGIWVTADGTLHTINSHQISSCSCSCFAFAFAFAFALLCFCFCFCSNPSGSVDDVLKRGPSLHSNPRILIRLRNTVVAGPRTCRTCRIPILRPEALRPGSNPQSLPRYTASSSFKSTCDRLLRTSGSSLQRDLGQGETTLGKGVINGAKPAQTGRLPRSATATKAGNTGRDMTEEDRDAACQQLMEDTLLEKLPLPKQIPVGPTPPIPSKPAGTLPRSATPMNFYAPSPTRDHRSSNGLSISS